MSYGYKTTLELNGEVMDVSVCSYSFEKDIDEYGDVTSPVIGGTIYLSIIDIPGADILSWAMEHKQFRNGKIKVTSQDEGMVLTAEEVTFENAACINLKLNYERDNASYFTTLLTISAENICIGQNNCWINKEWAR